MKKKTVYLAGPLFSEAEREYNQKLARKLEALGFRVLLPQERCAHIDGATNLDGDEKNQKIFNICLSDDLECDIFIYILDGRVPDEGAAVELGIAYAQRRFDHKANKLIIGLKTDWRICFKSSDLNQMISQCLNRIHTDEKSLIEFLTPLR
jgi:nucleoside 2-deoxyribosyltransferase